MGTKNLALVVGSYDDTASAADDYESLRSGQDAGGYEIIGAVVLVRDKDGKVEVREHGDKSVGHGAAWGAGAGVVVGLFAPPLLAATAVGAGIGAILGKIKKNREEIKKKYELRREGNDGRNTHKHVQIRKAAKGFKVCE